LKKEQKKLNNAIFIVTGEKSCPCYDVGDELKVESGSLSISAFKPVCLYLSDTIKTVVTAPDISDTSPERENGQCCSRVYCLCCPV
jgi:CRP/FNR family cyclic AMP-dependent transcriptional regulator